MIECPNCGSSRFYYRQRVYEYHYFSHVEPEYVELTHLEDAVVDDDYPTNFWCEDCDKTWAINELAEIFKETNNDS